MKKKKESLKSAARSLNREEMKKIMGGFSGCTTNYDCPIGYQCCPYINGPVTEGHVVFICGHC
jgi:hypothetical protein